MSSPIVSASPSDYLACLCERNRALLAHDRAEQKLCSLLLCNRTQLDRRLLEHKSSTRRSPTVIQAEMALHKAERELDEASSLLELAEAIRSQKQVDNDLQSIDC